MTDRVGTATVRTRPPGSTSQDPQRETHPAGHLQRLLCFLRIAAKVPLIPTAGTGAASTRGLLPGSSGAASARVGGWLWLAPGTSDTLFPGVGLPGGPGRGSRRQGRGPGGTQGLRLRPRVCPPHLRCPVPATVFVEGPAPPCPLFPEVYRLWSISPKSLALCFGVFS